MRSADRPSEYDSQLLSAAHRVRLRRRIVEVAYPFWHALLGIKRPVIDAAMASFFEEYPTRPVRDNTGGSGYNDCVWIYTAARLLGPRTIIESGIYKGQTTWLLRRACPDARILAFDVDLGQRLYVDPATEYHEGDWTERSIESVDGGSALCFFDDHVNQARRVREAYDRGFRTLLFDDNLTADTLYATGQPPVPTVSMLFDDELQAGERIEWLHQGKRYSYVVDPADTFGARERIASSHPLPDLTPTTRYRPQGGLSLVRLRA